MKQINPNFNLSADKLELLDLLLADEGLIEAPAALTIPPRPSGDAAVSLSFAQQRIWFLEALLPDSGLYNTPMVLHFKGTLDEAVLAQACQALVQRHESLRTTFTAVSGIPQQIIHATSPVTLDKRTAPADGVEAALQTAVLLPFDLENGPLLRFHLFQVSPTDHYLLLVFHHIIFDGWSSTVILDDLVALYDGFCHHREPQLAELPIQYADYAVWQREWLTGETLQKQLSYWQEQLGGELPFLQMPTDMPRPAMKTYKGNYAYVELPTELSNQLMALSKQTGATPFMLLLAAFKVLLHHYTNQDDILVGTPIANRQRTELERLVGFFVNTLVLRSQVDSHQSFRQLLAQVRQTATAAYDHQDVPFEKLVEVLQPERNLSYDPLFQVMFNYQEGDALERSLPGLTISLLHMDNRRAQFDLTLTVSRKHGRFLCSFNYNTDLFTHETIEQKLDHWQMLLAGLVANPDQPIGQACLLTPAEKSRVLTEWNATERPFPHHTLTQLFSQQVKRTPEATAVTASDTSLTYAELEAKSNQLAAYLRQFNIQPDSLIGLALPRNSTMLVAILGILKAGGAYLPIDPSYPAQRVQYMLEHAQAPLLITNAELVDSLPEHQAKTVLIDADWEQIGAMSAVSQDFSQLDTLAYVIYTSGSTGLPKGVQITNRNLANFLNTMQEQPGISPADTLLAVTTLSFDIATLELYLPLISGARVLLADQTTIKDATLLRELLETESVTMMQATPATWQMLLASGWQGKDGFTILTGGEALSTSLGRQLLDCGTAVWNMYGPTETTVWSTCLRVTEAECETEGVISIGTPIGNTDVYILNDFLNPVPVGVTGNLYIGGQGVARGYLHRPDLTAERFRQHPFKPEERIYFTGDVARYHKDGRIEFLGRSDHQVKIRGFRIELGEIEAVLRQHTVVQDAVVMALDDGTGPRLVAYLVGNAVDMAELRPFLNESLPAYMIPAAFVPLERFPQTPNGKIDRKALPAPEGMFNTVSEDAFVLPQDALEVRLVQIWQEVLQLPAVSVEANYFDMGGHSLQAVALFAAIEKELGLRLPVSLLFQAPTVRQLAEAIRQRGELDLPQWSSLVPIQPLGNRTPLFCVHGGAGHVFHYRDLAQLLGAERPFYGLQPKLNETTHQSIYETVEEMATHYIREIKMLQPQGPYLLSGFCFGGIVAYEMAQQLLREGDEVGVLAFIDPSTPQNKPKMGPVASSEVLTDRVARHKNNMAELGLLARLRYILQSGRNRVRRHWLDTTRNSVYLWRYIRGQLLELYINWRPKVPTRFSDFYFMNVISIQAIRDYRPQKYPGEAVLFYSTLENSGDDSLGWGDLPEDGLKMYAIESTHLGILKRPSIDQVAEKLQKHLEQFS